MAELHETLMGKKLIEGTLPDIANQLKRIADTMEKATSDVDTKKVIEFLEYEEALTKDPKTATRIALLLKELNIWN
jgi:Holliday junction resolvase RusA-like endonuclease